MDCLKTKWIARCLLVALILISASTSAWWMDRYGYFTRPPQSEAALYRLHAQAFAVAFSELDLAAVVERLFNQRHHHSQLIPLVAGMVSQVFDGDLTPAALWTTEALFGVLFALGTWRLARNFGGHWLALSTVAIAMTCPIVVVYLRPFYLQLPLAAATTWALDALVRCRSWTHRGYSIAFGFWVGIAFLCKAFAPIYVVGGLLLTIWHGFTGQSKRSVLAANFGLAMLVAAFIFGPTLWVNFSLMLGYTQAVMVDPSSAIYGPPLWTLDRWLYYPIAWINNGVGFPMALLLLCAGIAHAWRRFRSEPAAAAPSFEQASLRVVGVSCAVGVALLTFGQAAGESQYLLSFIPPSAILLCLSVAQAKSRRIRTAIGVLIAIVCVWNFGLANRAPSRDIARISIGRIELVGCCDYFITTYTRGLQIDDNSREEWPNHDFAARIAETSSSPDPLIYAMHPYVCGENLMYEAAKHGRRLSWTMELSNISRCDYIVVDGFILDSNAAIEQLRKIGIEATSIAHRQVTPKSDIHLLKVKR